MDDSFDSLGDLPPDDGNQDATSHSGSHEFDRYKHLFALQGKRHSQAKEKLTLSPRPSRITPPRPIPYEVLVQLEKLLDQAIQSMVDGKEPPILAPIMWDVILVLRRARIPCSDLLHLEAPTQTCPQGCLEQDASGSWWLLVKLKDVKAGDNYRRISIQTDSGVVEAVHRQYQRIITIPIPDYHNEHFLFRHDKGLLTSAAIRKALRTLAEHLFYQGRPFVISTRQFCQTIAQDFLEYKGNFSMCSRFPTHTHPCPSPVLQCYACLEEVARLLERVDEFLRGERRSSQGGERQDEEQEGTEE